MPEYVLFDIDSSPLPTYGNQEGKGFNYHYQAHDYHPKVCFDVLTENLLRTTLYDGTDYCSKDSSDFLKPLIAEYKKNYPFVHLTPKQRLPS
ncbi:transposase [Butyrivibrio sp.]|uniref:transposase n=1 Tax=Butyrivibrio sp. TaxID=28121 RepID=UPI003FA4A757